MPSPLSSCDLVLFQTVEGSTSLIWSSVRAVSPFHHVAARSQSEMRDVVGASWRPLAFRRGSPAINFPFASSSSHVFTNRLKAGESWSGPSLFGHGHGPPPGKKERGEKRRYGIRILSLPTLADTASRLVGASHYPHSTEY